VRTFARVAPSDAVQAAVQVRLQRDAGCAHTYVVDDGEFDGEAITTSFELTARAGGLDVVGSQEFDPRATDYRALASSIAGAGADCVLIAAIADSNTAAVTTQLATALPTARLFASAGVAESTYARGIPMALEGRLEITTAALDPSVYPPQGRTFLQDYALRFGAPEPDAIFGYEAMSLLLSAITHATNHGRTTAERSKVVKALFATRRRLGATGPYSIQSDGDTTEDRYGVWTVVDKRLRFLETVDG
jgi:branched-chain amino acid transport system substrate-binding protein